MSHNHSGNNHSHENNAQHSDENHHGHHHEIHRSQESDDKDMTFDFSKIGKLFSSKMWSGKAAKALLIALLIIIPVIFTIYIRAQPQYLPATDTWAQNSVYNYYKNGISQQVAAQYPNLPAAQRDTLVNQQFEQFKASNADQLDASIKQTSAYFKTGFQYEENGRNWTFLGDIDSYDWLRYARNIEEKGMVCDVIINGTYIDDHMLAPLGYPTGPSMHPYATVYLYKVMKVFEPKTTLMHAAYMLPMIIAIVAAISAFFIGRRIMNNTAGFFAAMFVAASPLFLSRTLGSDTDVWNVMFPLLALWIFLEAYEAKSNMKKFVLAGITGLVLGAFSFAWGGWWYIFDFMIAAVVGYIIYELVKNYIEHRNFKKLFNRELAHSLMMLAILIVSAGIFVTLFSTLSNFTSAVTAPLDLSSNLKIATFSSLWPNVYTTVAELNAASIGSVIGQTSFG